MSQETDQELLNRCLTELEAITGKFKNAERDRPERPDDSEAAVLFSAYDAMSAAAGRIDEAILSLEADLPEIPEAKPQEQISRDEMTNACEKALRTVEHLAPTLRAEETRGHAESAIGKLTDAMDLLSGKMHPRENPEPYERHEATVAL